MSDEGEGDTAERAAAAQQQNGGNFFYPFTVELPEKLDFRDPADWKRWMARWERYRLVSSLHLRDENMQGHPTVAVDEVGKSGHGKGIPKETKTPSRAPPCRLRTAKSDDAARCRWCGGARNHTKTQCPAAGKTCHSCGKKGHYATVCLSSARKSDMPNRSSERRQCMEELHLGEVRSTTSSEPWGE
ncbi:hypothetical protein MTO96_031308 [Rhipicephalus appendiculatus]